MEGAAVAHVCILNKVPFIIIRALSDFADDTAETHNEHEKPAADIASEITEYICVNLWKEYTINNEIKAWANKNYRYRRIDLS